MMNPPGARTAVSGHVRRVSAVLLSLVMPGAGHFLLGAFRRGTAWAVGLATFGLLLLFATPVSLLIVSTLVALVVGLVGRVAAAIDTIRIGIPRPAWKIVIVAWAALLAGDLAMVEPLQRYYRAHYAQAFRIPSDGMQPMLLVGDYIMVNKSAYRDRAPQRGDIVVFPFPQDERRDFIKRTIGLPGDTIELRNKRVYVNGTGLDEPYIRYLFPPPGDSSDNDSDVRVRYGPVTVPADHYFVLGDNRDNSEDSRYWGFLEREKIKGRAYMIYWSWDGDGHWPRFDRVGRSF